MQGTDLLEQSLSNDTNLLEGDDNHGRNHHHHHEGHNHHHEGHSHHHEGSNSDNVYDITDLKSTADDDDTRSTSTVNRILCCLCGTAIPPNPTNMCLTCLRSQVDITEDFTKEEIVFFCRECERYLQPPKFWLRANLESQELLTFCLKRVKGLTRRNDVKLVDARFLWTEPHSRRLKVRITIQKEIFGGARIQQSFVVEYVIKNMQCDACRTTYTKYDWVASVQVRQKVDHKKTFLLLEQLILKNDMHSNCVNIKEVDDGLDFYYNHKSHANKFRDFVCSVVPTTSESSKRLITQDLKSNTFNYKYSISCTIAPICREDLICLPRVFWSSMGGMGPMVLCYKVNHALHFLDPQTMQRCEIPPNLFFKNQFDPVLTSKQLVEYIVMNVEPLETKFPHKKFKFVEAEVVKSDQIGNEDQVKYVRSHLGHLLQPGDTVLGYDLELCNFNDADMLTYKQSKIPEVILVRKFTPRASKKKRRWKVKQLEIEKAAERKDPKKDQEELEQFYDDIEQDDELRKKIDVYMDESRSVTVADTESIYARSVSEAIGNSEIVPKEQIMSKKDRRKLKKKQKQTDGDSK